MLYVFEDNETVIKMIIKCRSPTMRHVSRTHRVVVDWLFVRMNLDPEILLRYVDTKHQLADMLTKENFTRDEWNNLLHLLNISHFSSACCAKNFSLISCTTRWRRGCESKPTAMSLVSCVSTNTSSVNSLTVSKSWVILNT